MLRFPHAPIGREDVVGVKNLAHGLLVGWLRQDRADCPAYYLDVFV
jgi:hypothetical protein